MNIELLFNGFLNDIELPIRSEEELIRIEKKLVLETKINKNISRSDIEEIIYVLKNYCKELQYIQSDKNLIDFLLKKKLVLNPISEIINEEDRSNISNFINKILKESFYDSIFFYFNKNRFSELFILSYYSAILSENIQSFIDEEIFSKMNYMISVLDSNLNLESIKAKLSLINTEDFFIMLDVYPSHNLEAYLNQLINIIIEDFDNSIKIDRKEFYYELLNNMNKYEAISPELNKVIKQNHRFANENKGLFNTNMIKNIFYLIWILSILYRCNK